MYGKVFDQLFTGSMVGAGAHVFSTFTYMIACCDSEGVVDVHPITVGAILGEPPERVEAALLYIQAKDAKSRSTELEGRRAVQLLPHRYQLVNYKKFRDIRNEEDRREQNRLAQKKHRDKLAGKLPRQDNPKRQQRSARGQQKADVSAESAQNREHRSEGKDQRESPPGECRGGPALSEVASLWTAEGLRGDPQRFRLWYGAHGWPAGDWHDAARLWSLREKGEEPGPASEKWGANRPAYADAGLTSPPADDERQDEGCEENQAPDSD
jgi:hypothetical protein